METTRSNAQTPTAPASHGPACTCRCHPLPADMKVRAARDAYLAENGFTMAAYDAPTTEGSLLGYKFRVPNPPSHQRAIRLHDLHHVATGYGTDHAGEGEISMWQIRRGLGGANLYVAGVVSANALLGVLLAPRRTFAALRHARRGRSLFNVDSDYDVLLDKTVGELRALLGVPADGLARGPRALHALAPPAPPHACDVQGPSRARRIGEICQRSREPKTCR